MSAGSASADARAGTLALLVGGVAFDAAVLLLPRIPRAALEPVLLDLVARARRAAAEMLAMDGVACPAGCASWADHPGFRDPPLSDADWAEAAGRLLALSGAPHSMAEAERIKENFLALLRQLEYEERVGTLSSNAEFERVFGFVVDTTRSRFLALPAAAAARLAGVTDTAAVFAILTEMVRDALSELSETNFDDVMDQLARRPAAKPNGAGHA